MKCLLFAGIVSALFACEPKEHPVVYHGQDPTLLVPTKTKPVQRQWKGIWAFEDSSFLFSNDFEGGRLNGVAYDGSGHFTLWITAENYAINPSPWYAFQVWAKEEKEITIQLTYLNSRNRYYPKISRDGMNFAPLDSTDYKEINPGEGDSGMEAAPESIEFRLKIDEHPTWVSAQELWTSSRVKTWIDSLSDNPVIDREVIGYSREKRPLMLLKIGDDAQKQALMVISRQHPPEVTGFLTMKSFVETIAGSSQQAKAFREQFITYVIPLMNPDGVDNGHWRHNMGGVDLNRDWQAFNQPETRAVRAFLNKKKEEGFDFVFGGDFHSTWQDIYYPLDSSITQKEDLIIYRWIDQISKRMPEARAPVQPSATLTPTMVSRNYFYLNHQMPSIVFELGDNTSRGFLREKGKVAAEELMSLLLANGE